MNYLTRFLFAYAVVAGIFILGAAAVVVISVLITP